MSTNSAFLTETKGGEPTRKKRTGATFDFKECVEAALIKRGAPLRVAEIACIDLRSIVTLCYHNKLTATQTAEMMWLQVEKLYKSNNGRWHY